MLIDLLFTCLLIEVYFGGFLLVHSCIHELLLWFVLLLYLEIFLL